MYDVLIIGAGPAGLSAGYELSKTNKKILILEKNYQVGGLAQTKIFGEFRYDIGPHRFFTKNDEINDLFLEMLGDDAVTVNRKTRILFNNSYFDYPLTPLNALFGLGLIESITIGFSYVYARIRSYLKITKVNNFEDWVVDKFGKRLFSNFFKNYTEKVWGIDCKEIGRDWAAQRIKGLSLSTAVKFALFPNSKKRPKTLVDKFYYPKLGAGMLWEKFESYLEDSGTEIKKSCKVTEVKEVDNCFQISYLDKGEQTITVKSKNIFFSSPLLEFVDIFNSKVPEEVTNAANSLNYRNHISVHVTIDTKLFDDNWIYIHSPDLKMARITDFTNFSKEMSIPNTYPLTLEYFCYESDEIWNKDNDSLIDFATKELNRIFQDSYEIIHSEVSRNPKAYPVIKTGYEEKIEIIRKWLDSIDNVTPIGRSGMFKYNNQDHAMATAIAAVRQYMGDTSYDPWNVNIDGEYHELITDTEGE